MRKKSSDPCKILIRAVAYPVVAWNTSRFAATATPVLGMSSHDMDHAIGSPFFDFFPDPSTEDSLVVAASSGVFLVTLQGFVVTNMRIFDAAAIVQRCVLGADRRVIEASRH